MKKISMARGIFGLLILCLFTTNVSTQFLDGGLRKELRDSVARMIEKDVDTKNLLGVPRSYAKFIDTTYLMRPEVLAKECHKELLHIPQFDAEDKTVKYDFEVCPYERVKPLQFAPKGKIWSLTTRHNIGTSQAYAETSAFVAYIPAKSSATTVAQASAYASASVNKQSTIAVVRQCKKFLFFWETCKPKTVIKNRALYLKELDLIGKKLERLSLLSLKARLDKALSLGSPSANQNSLPLNALANALKGGSIHDISYLKVIYPVILHDVTEISNVQSNEISNIIKAASMGMIKEYSSISQISNYIAGRPKSSFCLIPTTQDMVVLYFESNTDSTYKLTVLSIKVEGKLPYGAQATGDQSRWTVRKEGSTGSYPFKSILQSIPYSN